MASWPHVWNYSPGSKRSGLTEKKTAVRQWITVLWPDECLSEEWIRKLGSVSRITDPHMHTPIYIYMHIVWTCLWAHICADGMTKSCVVPLLASGLSPEIFYTSVWNNSAHAEPKWGKANRLPPRYRETFTFLATIRSRGGAGRNISDLPEMPFCLWLGLWEVCTVPFGSGAALQCKQLTSSGWPLWTEQAASHEHAGAGGAQWFFSLTATGSAPEDCGPMAKQRTNLPTFERLWKILLCMNTSSSAARIQGLLAVSLGL